MLAVHRLRQTSCRLALTTASRSTFAKADEKQPTSSINYPGFYDATNANRSTLPDAKRSSSITQNSEPVPLNDLLEAKRVQEEQQKTKLASPSPVTTSREKFVAGLTPIPGTSSITPTSTGLFQNAEVSSTPISPGIPISTARPLAVAEDQPKKDDRLPSSRFVAFLRSIRSGLPIFPSSKAKVSPIDIATTREYFIPLTRPSLIRLIATSSEFVNDEEDRLLFHQLCQGFDSAVSQRYQSVLTDLKHLFNPLNPDNETLDNRRVAYRDRLDNEYWLLQKIDDLFHRANFTELPRDLLLNKFLLHQDSLSSANLQIRIDGHDYDVLKFWILGREQASLVEKSWWKKVLRRQAPTIPTDYFKRVVVAVRLKGQDRLYLKAFRDIPLQNLTQLLPVGKLQTGNLERKLMVGALAIGGTTAVTNLISTMADYHISGLLLGGSSASILLGLWAVRSFYTSKINYLSSMNRTLFYKNVASNKQLLAMIVDRAQDELSKEVLLVYLFILWKQRQDTTLTAKNLELDIENWIRWTTNSNITFKSDQSIEFLRQLGILLPDDPSRPGSLKVLPFKQVAGVLPQLSRTLSEKQEEWDLIEGYDKKYFELDWKTVLNEDQLLNKSGWR